MVHVAWATDLHLDWLDHQTRREFFETAARATADCLVLTGDVGDGQETAVYLKQLASAFGRPIYFVLGNHDCYGRSIARARREMGDLAAASNCLVYLTATGLVELGPGTALVGHDGWGDARAGDFENSRVCLPDFVAIEDLAEIHRDRPRLRRRLQELGDEAARHIARLLPGALELYPRLVVATHVPPFCEAARHRGSSSDDDWLPYCVCRAVGEVLVAAADRRPDRLLLVLCGHTHESCETEVRPNLRVFTGGPDDSRAAIQRTFEW